MTWTEEMVDCVKQSIAKNMSAAQIAGEIWDAFRVVVSRCAVIGIVHRKGLGPLGGNSGRPQAPKAPRPRRPRAMRLRVVTCGAGQRLQPCNVDPGFDADGFAATVDDGAIPAAQRRTLLNLTADCCRWPIGDPGKPDFFFCGNAALPGYPYCAPHASRAYQTYREFRQQRDQERRDKAQRDKPRRAA